MCFPLRVMWRIRKKARLRYFGYVIRHVKVLTMYNQRATVAIVL